MLGVYTRSMETIYLPLRAKVAVGTFFMKFPVPSFNKLFADCFIRLGLVFIVFTRKMGIIKIQEEGDWRAAGGGVE